MKNIKQNKTRAIQMVSILAALTFAPPALAEGCTVSDVIPEQLVDVGDFDGNMSCGNWTTMEDGCSLDPDDNGTPVTCFLVTNAGKITITAVKEEGLVNWSAESNVLGLGVDKVILDNATKANGCLQNNKFDAFSGSIVFIKSNGQPSATRGVEFCADAEVSEAPPPPQVAVEFPSCQLPDADIPGGIDDTEGGLDDTGIVCPTYNLEEFDAAWTAYNEAKDAGEEVEPPEFEEGDQKPVVVCNLEKDKEDWGTTDGSDVCCQCGIPEAQQTACVVTEDRDECAQSMTVNPTQSVELMFFKDDVDPCTWIKTSKGWKQWCY